VRSEEEGRKRKEESGRNFFAKNFLPEPLFKKLYKCLTLNIDAVLSEAEHPEAVGYDVLPKPCGGDRWSPCYTALYNS
jgi:hypothetical protein